MKSFITPALLCSAVLALTGSLARADSCPPFGWSEGLVGYTLPTSAFPTEDTRGNPTADCVFHEWSWEAFVWATAMDENNQPRFQSLPTPDDLNPTLAAAHEGKPRTLVLKVRNLEPKGTQQAIGEFQQAGSAGVLVDPSGQPVFYSVHMDTTYLEFVEQYYGVTKYANACPTVNFPLGAAIFKAAWKIVPAGTTPTGFYTTPATVPLLVNNPKGGIMVDPSGATRSVTVALVGLHVVGITRNHPEFLWGTFEQVQNSPDLANPSGYNSPNPVSSQNYTFYAAGTAAKDCNQLATVSVSNPTSQTLAPITNVFRQYATGGENAAGDAEIANITSQSQKALLAMKNTAEAVWANYKLIGTVWLPPGGLQPGDGSLDAQAVGSSNLADSSLETFVQGPQNNNGTNASCFMCHTTEGFSNFGIPGKNINLSHLLLEPLFAAGSAAKASATK